MGSFQTPDRRQLRRGGWSNAAGCAASPCPDQPRRPMRLDGSLFGFYVAFYQTGAVADNRQLSARPTSTNACWAIFAHTKFYP